MTDNEIIKALECNPLDDIGGCRKTDVLSLINSQKAEIAEIQKNSETLAIALVKAKAEIDHFRKVTKKAKTDLKYYLDTNEENGVVWIPKFTVNNLVKEMTEDEGK